MQKEYNLKSVNMISPKYDLTLSILNKTVKEMTEFPEGITYIGSIFEGCTELERVILPEGITTIDVSAFSNCTKLYYIELPKTLKKINNYAFEKCNNLSSLVYRGTIEEWNLVSLSYNWDYDELIQNVICSDGTINLKEE